MATKGKNRKQGTHPSDLSDAEIQRMLEDPSMDLSAEMQRMLEEPPPPDWVPPPPSPLQYRDFGHAIMLHVFRRNGVEFSEEPLKRVLEWFSCASVDALYFTVGKGIYRGNLVFDAAFGKISKENIVFLLPEQRAKSKAAGDTLPVAETKKPGYTGKAPSSSPADTSTEGMGDDFNTSLTVERRLANYEALARHVDLENLALALAEQRRRANRLLTAYERVQEVKQGFKDSNAQLTAARRIKEAARRERQRAKRPPAPRGRPRKAATP